MNAADRRYQTLVGAGCCFAVLSAASAAGFGLVAGWGFARSLGAGLLGFAFPILIAFVIALMPDRPRP